MQDSAAEIQFRLFSTKRPPAEAASGDTPASADGRVPRITEVMALAIQFQDMIHREQAQDYADLARLGCLCRERMSQIMELIWLAPDIQRELLEFKPTNTANFPVSEAAMRRIAANLDWGGQREAWRNIKQNNHLD